MKTGIKYFIQFLFYINFIPRIFSLSCNSKLSQNNWLDEWRLLITTDENNQYQLLRTQNVPVNNTLYMLCKGNAPLITAQCRWDQNFDISLPLSKKCTEIESIQPTRTTGSSCKYTLYKVGFNIKINARSQFLEAYRVCFDHHHMRPLYTINKAYPVGGSRPKFLNFNPDDIFYGKLFSAFSRRSTFERFQKLLGDKQNFMSASNVDHIIDRGHLSPSADFVTTNLKRSTFNMINVIPQFKTIDNGNWRLIEEWARHPSRTPANICNGVLDCNLKSDKISDLNCILTLPDVKGQMVPMFLADNRKIPIPLWSYKVVKTKQNSIVFLTYNNIYHKGHLKAPHHVCIEVKCPLQLAATFRDGRTFCCSYNEFINKNIPNLKGDC